MNEHPSPPFRTRNTLLAFALKESGFKWYHKGNPCTNIYDLEDLKARGLATVHAAVESNYCGEVDYFFERTPDLEKCINAFDAEQKFLRSLEKNPKLAATYDIEPETMMRIVCRCQKTYGAFKQLWKLVPPKLRVRNPGKPKTTNHPDGSKTVRMPGYRVAGADASDETLRRLKMK